MIVFAEEDLIRAARIRQSLGISFGQNEESALLYRSVITFLKHFRPLRDKIKMKNKLMEAGIKVPQCAPVESASDVVSFCEKHGFDVQIN